MPESNSYTAAMPAPPSDTRSKLAEVVSVTECGGDGVLLKLRAEGETAAIRAGRFYMLKREDGTAPLIPRPFSLYRQSGSELEFLIKVMGKGTRSLAEAAVGSRVRVIGPLGNGWPELEGGGAPWVMLGGGIGSAPFFMAIEAALRGSCDASELTFIYGAQTSHLLYDLDAFKRLGIRVETATDDGSLGTKGNVLDVLGALQKSGDLPREVRLLACGPDPMLAAIERHARANELDCWLSLETLMGCGVGICNGCPVPTLPDGAFGDWTNAKCCVEGPVFSVQDVTLAH